ncbi:glycoside hydrolase [Micromonospora sp. NPDC049891]|uniref:glycoside hydrolase n=1 Tax=Micromonospora sp. NPDC049891 TaxID=3155655 RepID=UPI0033C4D679
MRRRTTWTIRLATALVAAGSLVASTAVGGTAHRPTTPPTAVVDWNAERQMVDGFGGAFAFHKAGGIQRLGEPLTSQMLDMIFDDEAGIGLDIVRVMVGDGGVWGDQLYDGPTQTIEPEPGTFVWDRPDWAQRKADFDAHQIWLMRQAQARGVETILASVWSPPAWMKQNNSVTSSGSSGAPNKLRPDMYQAFADYLAEYVLGYEREFGIRITHLSPTNEPDISTGYSSCQWTAEELRVLVRDHLGPTFERRGVTAKIVLGEGVGFHEGYALPTITDPEANRYVDVVAAHGYAGLVDDATRAAPTAFTTSHALGKTIWQTEYMNQGAPRDRLFVNNTMSDGLRYATLIGNLFDETRLGAYFWWWPVANNGADGSDLIRLVNTGTPQSGNPTENGQYRIFKRYYTFGQYSRFLDPGDVMIGATSAPSPGVTVTAYKDEATHDFTIVVVNNNPDDVPLTVDLTGGFPLPPETRQDCKKGGWASFVNPTFRNQGECVSHVAAGKGPRPSVVPYRTSGNENMKKLADIHTHGGSFSTNLRGHSVTTFVPKWSELPALPDRKDVFSTYLAEKNDGQSRGLRVVTAPEHGRVVTGVRDGSHLRWANVNFADGSAAGFADQKGQLRLHVTVAPKAGGVIEARIGSPDGPLVGSMTVPPGTGTDWVTATTGIDTSPQAANGFHDLYLVFTGGAGTLFTVDRAEFSD